VNLMSKNIIPENVKNKKIIFVINTLKEGGAAKILAFVANLCTNLFETVYIITVFSGETHVSLDDRINLIDLGMKVNKGILTKISWRFKLAKILRREILRINPDVVCAFISDVIVNTKFALLGTNIPLVAAERGDPYTLNWMWKGLTKLVYSTCDYLVFQTEMARDFFKDKVMDKSIIIANPYIYEGSQTVFRGKRKKIVVSAGRFVEQKGYDVLIRAFKKVHDCFPDYNLIIYGDGKLRGEYERLIKELNLDNYVSLPGYMAHVQNLIRECSVFVLSSRFEGIPNALIEAMTVGVPTVSTNCTPGGPAFLTDNGRRGILVPVDDVDAIANGIIRIISNEQYANELSELGLELIKELDPDHISKQWMKVFSTFV